MENQKPVQSGAGDALIDQELTRLAAAIELVAAGSAPRVTLAGLRFGEALLPQAERLTRGRGVRVRPLWPMGDGPVDLVIEVADA